MTFFRWLAVGALAITFSASARADEQAGCSCVTVPAGAGAIGQVAGAEGDVMMSSREGFRQPAAGQAFGPNTEFILGCQAAASIRVGSDCNLTLQPGSRVSVVQTGNNVCVRTTGPSAPCGEGMQSGSLQSSSGMHEGRPHFGGPEIIFLGTVGLGAAVAAGLGNGDEPASP
jgi:hypothetical protein